MKIYMVSLLHRATIINLHEFHRLACANSNRLFSNSMWCFLGFSRPNVVFSKNLSGNCVVNVNKHGVGVCIDFFVSIFTARRYASAVLAVVVCPSVRLSVCPSVCLSQAGIVSKRQHIESRKQRRTVAQGI